MQIKQCLGNTRLVKICQAVVWFLSALGGPKKKCTAQAVLLSLIQLLQTVTPQTLHAELQSTRQVRNQIVPGGGKEPTGGGGGGRGCKELRRGEGGGFTASGKEIPAHNN